MKSSITQAYGTGLLRFRYDHWFFGNLNHNQKFTKLQIHKSFGPTSEGDGRAHALVNYAVQSTATPEAIPDWQPMEHTFCWHSLSVIVRECSLHGSNITEEKVGRISQNFIPKSLSDFLLRRD